jgi:hypothetical protein
MVTLPDTDFSYTIISFFNANKLFDTLWPMNIVHPAFGIPIFTLGMRNFFSSVSIAIREAAIVVLFSTEYPVACYAGSAPEQNLYPKGQNFVICRPLAAGIEILKILHVY